MYEDDDIYELFLEIMEQVQKEAPAGRMRVLSKDPRYAADDPAAQNIKSQNIERR